MSNEIILLIKTCADLLLLSFFCLFGIEGITAVIVLNLILVSIFGSSLVNYFHFLTNEGNGFYAIVLFGFVLLCERFGKHAAEKIVWACIIGVIGFITFAQLNMLLQLASVPHASPPVFFTLDFQLIVASLFSFALSSQIIIFLYTRFSFLPILLRLVAAQVLAQLIDTILFFLFAFVSTPNAPLIRELIIGGLIVKFLTIFFTIPFFYMIRLHWNTQKA